MAIYDGIIFCSDMDGTMTDTKGVISKKNAEAIRYFQQNGGLFTVATGRPPYHPEKFSDIFVCNTYIIALNGSMIFDPMKREFIEKHPLDDSAKYDIKKIMETFSDVGQVQIHGEEGHFVQQQGEDADSFLGRINERMFDIMFIQDYEKTAKLKDSISKAFPDYKFCRGWSEGLEMFSANAGKGNGVMKTKKLTDSRLAVTAGNYDNDIEMLLMADLGVCVNDSSPDVLAAADIVTVDCNNDPIAVIIDELRKEKPFL